ncbi:S1 family peptidase [Telmatospirillum siberiense]|nr:serine protease [Telmatospirillum siberiense]
MTIMKASFLSAVLVLLAILAAPMGESAAQTDGAGECEQLVSATDLAYGNGDLAGTARFAATLFSRCQIADEDWARLSFRYAAALSHAGRKEEALGVLGRCITRQPKAALCYSGKAAVLSRLGRQEEAGQARMLAQTLGALPREGGGTPSGKAVPPPSAQPGPAGMPAPRAETQAGRSRGEGAVKAGTGFFIDDRGHLVTNAHVVSGCGRLETAGKAPLKLIGVDGGVDLAVLQMSAPPAANGKLRLDPPLRVGEDVLAFGFPLPGLLSSEGNVTVGILSATRGVADDPHVLQMTAPVQSGNSGGPLLDGAGNVIGVVVSKLDAANVLRQTGDLPQNVNFAIKASELALFLDRLKIPYGRATATVRQNTADLAEAATKMSVQIICSGR